jgi:glycosyltransferase involved in cell wall biosynthesis
VLERISVVIPTRNEARNIGACLASIPAEVELVAVDASDDSTPEIIHALRPRQTQIIQSRAGIAAARQIGAEAASGEWLIFCDADICFAPDYFLRIAPYLALDAFYGIKLATATHATYARCFTAGQSLSHRMGFPAASGSNMAVRRRILQSVGGFRADLPVNEDSELFLRLAYHGYHVGYATDLAVHSLDDRRLDAGVARKLLHSAARCVLIAAALRVPLPQRLLRHDWGYWRPRRTHAR